MLEIQEAPWAWLEPHHHRGALILVSPQLDLEKVAKEVANNNSKLIQDWISSGLLSKPERHLTTEWSNAPEKTYRFVIVQPYVLIQKN